jgi:hypothetical protein
MELGSTEPQKEMSTRNISWGKSCWGIGLTNLPLSYVELHQSLEPGTLRAPPGLNRESFTLPLYCTINNTSSGYKIHEFFKFVVSKTSGTLKTFNL